MVPTNRLYDIIEQEGIVFECKRLPGPNDGFYIHDADMGVSYCVIDSELLRWERQFRAVLAHELGHHFAAGGRTVVAATRRLICYAINKTENMATRWAVDFLVPGDQFLRLVDKRYNLWELADWFYVPVSFIQERARRIWQNGMAVRRVRLWA